MRLSLALGQDSTENLSAKELALQHKIFEQVIATSEDMHELGVKISRFLNAGDLAILIGPLGAGKTTLTRGVGEGLEVEGNVSSPTFVVARTHKREGKAAFVHVDAYRLGSPAELDDLDIPFASSIVLVEWGKGLTDDISEHWLEVDISRDTSGATEDRQVKITGFGDRWKGVSI
jgi:tRNA threonylcarbamoyl adenosine modification protein YjeE